VPVDDIVAGKVLYIQRTSERFDSVDQRPGTCVVTTKGVVTAISVPADSQRRDEVHWPADRVVPFCQSETPRMKVQELVDESMVDGRGRSPRHELLDDEADGAGVDDGFGRNRLARLTSKPL